jgi:hypothetical protein
MNILIYPSPNSELNVNERMFAYPCKEYNFVFIENTKVDTLKLLVDEINEPVRSVTILLDDYACFINKNIDFILSRKDINFYIHENDLHYCSSKPKTFAKYLKLRNNLFENNHIYILSYYWYHYPKLYQINQKNIICFPKFVLNNNICDINTDPIMKVLLSGAISSHYHMRKYLKKLNHNSVDILRHQCNVKGENYLKFLNKYICAFTCCLNRDTPYIVNKFFEIPFAGCLLLAYDEFVKLPLQELGFIDGENYISCTKENIIDKINYICDKKNIDEINRIRINGYNLVKNNHTVKSRYEMLNKLVHM